MICKVCNKNYSVCNGCARISSWRNICCCEVHYQVFMVIMEYLNNKDKDIALESLLNIGLTTESISQYNQSTQNVINEILE